MFSQIKGVVEVVISGFKTIREFKSANDREQGILDLLRFYFLLKDCVDDGEALILEAGSNPIAKIAAMPSDKANKVIARWDLVLRRQASRLYTLQSLLFTQEALAVINPSLEARLSQAVGDKMNRTVNLHGIGSALVIRCMLPLDETMVEKATLVAMLAGERQRDKINLDRIRREVADLRIALDDYRHHVTSLATNDELLKLSKKARKVTRLPKEA